MTTLTRNNQNWLPSIFDEILTDSFFPKMQRTNAINVIEKEDAYNIAVAVPGMKKEDCQISLDDYGNLVIKVEKKEEHSEESGSNESHRYIRKEFSLNSFTQAFVLPKDVDKDQIGATVEHGILEVTLPKYSATANKGQRLIEIK